MNHQKTLIEDQERVHALQAEVHGAVAAMFGALLAGVVDEAIGGACAVIRLVEEAVALAERSQTRGGAPLPRGRSLSSDEFGNPVDNGGDYA